MSELHDRPKSFLELFEFMRYNKTKGILRDIAMASVKAGLKNG